MYEALGRPAIGTYVPVGTAIRHTQVTRLSASANAATCQARSCCGSGASAPGVAGLLQRNQAYSSEKTSSTSMNHAGPMSVSVR